MPNRLVWLALLTILAAGNSFLLAQEKSVPSAGMHRAAIGVTRQGTEIPVYLPRGAGNPKSHRSRVVILGGHDGSDASVALVQQLAEQAQAANAPAWAREVAYIPNVYPDGAPAKGTTAGYPPAKGYYDDADRPEARYLWRWIGMYGASLVIDVRAGGKPELWMAPGATNELILAQLKSFKPETVDRPDIAADDFVRQLATKGVQDVGSVPTVLVQLTRSSAKEDLGRLAELAAAAAEVKSPAWNELIWRERRTPEQIAAALATVYGHDLKQVAYIPALAVIGRERIATELSDQQEQAALQKLLAPFLSGQQNPVPKNGSEHAGHLLFAELAKRAEGQDRERWIELCKVAADQIFDKNGQPLQLMPSHNEMSDAVFMATPILCATGTLTAEKKYHDAAVTHFRNMQKLCLRDDGLYRHSPLDVAAWGRGNGFPALGLAWALSEFPEDHPAFPELKQEFQKHIAALLKQQDTFGCWHQVIDKPGSYREFSSTCMIGWALKRGLDRGWLKGKAYETALDRAWLAAKHRIGPKGVVVDICTGTGKQKSLRDYYDRPAIWGVDARGGAMALMFSTEMMTTRK
jgi:unsaturated rhamnogalacturonyl hydrolase